MSLSSLSTEFSFEALIKRLAVHLLSSIGKSSLRAFEDIERDYGDHLRQTFDRCSKVRTILNRDKSVDLLSIYTRLNFRSDNDKIFSDYDLIDIIRKKKRIVLSGVGGGGKTIFMKYLWLSFFEKTEGRVPLFVELRRFNDVTREDFLVFLFRTSLGINTKIEVAHFLEGMSEGRYSIFLDGFDEVNDEKRNSVETVILDISRLYPDIVVVISGRPEKKFDSWQDFQTFHVEPMNKSQSLDLIGKLQYDAKIKKKFIERVKLDLYDQHKSFLSSPLLSTMMLLTFDQFADIPEKMHLFYEQAFETLFAKHDATKEAYKRKTYTGLSIDVFKKLLSYFCLISYHEAKFEFSENGINEIIIKAIRLMDQNIDHEKFLQDLCESVCIIQRDGLKYVFTHRSFQEYFSAYCLSYLVPDKIGIFCRSFAARFGDTVIEMCYDMNTNLMEDKFLLPFILETTNISKAEESDIEKLRSYINYFQLHLVAFRNKNKEITFSLQSESENWTIHSVVRRIYKSEFKRRVILRKVTLNNLIDFDDSMKGVFSIKIAEIGENFARDWLQSGIIKESNFEITIQEFSNYETTQRLINDMKVYNALIRIINKRQASRAKSIDEIFSI